MPSIQVPARKPDTWHERSEWQQYANKLFRYYSRSSSYVLRFVHDPEMIAAVDVGEGRVFLNPTFPAPSTDLLESVRAQPTGVRENVVQYLNGLLAHEAAHVRFSSVKPAGLLGAVWNSIEDERIERLMARRHRDLGEAFTYIGDVLLTRRFAELTGDPLECVLFWRWAHDHPKLGMPCNDEHAWQRVRPHVEAAWVEPDPDRVVHHARAILTELGRREGDDTPEYLQGPEVSFPVGLGGAHGDESSTSRSAASPEAADQEEQSGDATDGTSDASEDSPADPEEPHGTANNVWNRAAPDANPTPEAPQILPDDPKHQRARELLREVEPKARALGAALALPEAPRTRISHQSRGRFDYGRYVQGAQRPFRVAHQPNRRKMPNLTVLHDVSSSMADVDDPSSNQFAAVRATMMMHRACELARTPFRLITFGSWHHVLVEPTADPEAARAAIAGIRSAGGTSLAPALAAALSAPWTAPLGKPRTHVVLVYCDGGIGEDDASMCREMAHDNPHAFILPVLIGAHVDETQFEIAFGRSLHAPDVSTLADRIRRWVAANLH